MPAVALIISAFQPVTEPFFSVRNNDFKKSVLVNAFHGIFQPSGVGIHNGNGLGAGDKRTYNHAFFSVFLHFVHTQHGMGVGMLPVNDLEKFVQVFNGNHPLIPFCISQLLLARCIQIILYTIFVLNSIQFHNSLFMKNDNSFHLSFSWENRL